MATKLKKDVKLLYMSIKQRTLKRSHTSALVDKNATITTVKMAYREIVERGDKLMKDVTVAMKNANSNEKLAGDKNKNSSKR